MLSTSILIGSTYIAPPGSLDFYGTYVSGQTYSWTIPDGVYRVRITLIGGGGAGTDGEATVCSIGGVVIAAGGGLNGSVGTGGTVNAVVGYVGQGNGGAALVNGTGSNGGWGGGGGNSQYYGRHVDKCGGGCGIGGGGAATMSSGGTGTFGTGARSHWDDDGYYMYPGSGYGFGSMGGGGAACAQYYVNVVPGTVYTNSITVGATGTGYYDPVPPGLGLVRIEWGV